MQLSLFSLCSLSLLVSHAFTPLHGSAVAADIAATAVAPHRALIEEFYSTKKLLKELSEEENYLKFSNVAEKEECPIALDSPVMRHYLLGMNEARFRALQEKYAPISLEDCTTARLEVQEAIKAVLQKDTQLFQMMDALQRDFDFDNCSAFVKALETLLLVEFMNVFICKMTHSYQLRMGLLERVAELKRQHGWHIH